jgi:serine/threonine-protein kinase PknK
MLSPERELRWLRQVRDVSQRLASETELSRLLPYILDAAIEITGAERGFLVLLSRGAARVKEARGFDRSELAREVAHVSRTVVERVLERGGDGLVTTSEQDRDVIDATSVQERRVVSILCVPLRLRGEIRGVLYLDHRLTRGAFEEADLPILRPFADQAALALESLGEQPEPAANAPAPSRFGQLVGGAPPMQALYAEIQRAARSWTPATILGERGTGKERVAREIHGRSARSAQPFVTLLCSEGASPLESELLGHCAGARPWADADRESAFQAAGGGTLFLDGVDELTPALQVELLRVLREGRATPLGGHTSQRVRCRVIVASHKDLRLLVDTDCFREDLYFQLDAHRIVTPPLRQHTEDLPLLIEHFTRQATDKASLKLSAHALEVLAAYSWPGNVRELKNEVGRLVALESASIPAKALSPEIQEGRGVSGGKIDYAGLTLEGVEREVIQAALAGCKGNKARAARQLGVPRSTLYHLLERHGL